MAAKQFDRILLLQTAFLGDAILTSPLIAALADVFPDAKLDVLCIPQTAEVFNRNPHVNEVLTFSKKRPVVKYLSLPLIITHLRHRRYGLGISVQSSLTSSLLMLAGGIPVRHGFSRQKLLTMSVFHARGVHKREKILNLIKPFSNHEYSMDTSIHWLDRDAAAADAVAAEIPQQARPRIGIAPGSIWPTKCWPEPRFRTLVRALTGRGYGTVLLGGKGDAALCERIVAGTGAVNAAGRLTVPASAALIKGLDILVTNDSAPLHIANAVDTPVLAIFGPTVKKLGFYPYRSNDRITEMELECRPCGRHGGKRCPKGHFNCMLGITPEHILDQIEQMTRAGHPATVKD